MANEAGFRKDNSEYCASFPKFEITHEDTYFRTGLRGGVVKGFLDMQVRVFTPKTPKLAEMIFWSIRRHRKKTEIKIFPELGEIASQKF